MKNILKSLKVSTLALSVLGTFAVASAEAVPTGGNKIAFDRAPNLVEATTLTSGSSEQGTYHFVIEVPADAGEALEAVVITPRDRAEHINFDLDATTARQGTAYAGGQALPLASIGGSLGNSEEILVVFEQPVQPGETVTVSLETDQNPFGGVYLFGITGFPQGENSLGQFLGYGRLHISGADG